MTGFTALDIDLFGDVAEGLARICRFGGHVPGNPYSVAQHCVIGADAAMEETRDANIAAYFLLHDAHEFVFGDMTTPVAKWLATIADRALRRRAHSMVET
jgi:5'-deoxynucleotidase YfbR-like HD superfamily hydrolase